MRTITYKLLFLLALLPSIIFAKNSPVSGEMNGRHTKQKKVSKQFNVSANDLLKIDNSYGNIDITTWDKNIVSIEVLIKTNGDDEDKVRQKLEDIRIEFNQSSSYVSAKTYFSKNENNSWWDILFGNSNNVNMEVNYIVCKRKILMFCSEFEFELVPIRYQILQSFLSSCERVK